MPKKIANKKTDINTLIHLNDPCDCTEKLKKALSKSIKANAISLIKTKNNIKKWRTKLKTHRQLFGEVKKKAKIKTTTAIKNRLMRMTETTQKLMDEIHHAKTESLAKKETINHLKQSLKKQTEKAKILSAFEKTWKKSSAIKKTSRNTTTVSNVKRIKFDRPDILGMKITGKLHHKHYVKQIVPKLDKLVTTYDKCRVYIEATHFHGWDFQVAIDEIKLTITHPHHIERIAIVGDADCEKWLGHLFGIMMDGEVAFFATTEKKTAKAWVIN